MLSVQDLIKKQCRREDKEIEIRIEQLDGSIKCRVPFMEEFKDLVEKHKEDTKGAMLEYVYLNVVEPRLNDNALIEHFNCKEKPYEIVEKIFTSDVASNIADILIDIREKESSVSVVNKQIEKIKN